MIRPSMLEMAGSSDSNNNLSSNIKGKNNKAHNQIGDNQDGLSNEERIELITLRVQMESLQKEVEGLKRERDIYKEFYENSKVR